MNAEQVNLYHRILKFSLDKPDSNYPFSRRLALENCWTEEYTQRVISEYKKFAFLAVVAGHPVAPSDQVDQVWHLHLIYTHSYWDEFCQEVLQKPLHHEPSNGGKEEQAKFHRWYNQTLKSYEAFFGYEPPTDIWLPPEIRFSGDERFVRVNRKESWIVPKLNFPTGLSYVLSVALVFSLTACVPLASTGNWNPLDFNGSEFLTFYGIAMVIGSLIAYKLRLHLQQPNPISTEESPLNIYEAAYLAEGGYRAVNTAIFNLVQLGYVRLESETEALGLARVQSGYVELESETKYFKLVRNLPENSHYLEKTVIEAVESDGDVASVHVAGLSAVNSIAQSLEKRSMLLDEMQATLYRVYPALVIGIVLLLGIAKIWVGTIRHKPVGYLICLCIFMGWLGYQFIVEKSLYRSRFGDRLLKNLRSDYSEFRKPTSEALSNLFPERAMAFALFGSSILAGSALADLGNVLAPMTLKNTGSYMGSGGCGGGGCGGCGGGGCGGCGG